jgi:peptidoglycan/LPS O-acetylase OafA/YrhL
MLLQPAHASQPESKSSWSANSRLPSLDGWRALSILLVLGSHSGMVHGSSRWKPFLRWIVGETGVLCFFVISGFLITWLLLVENDRQGQISLKNFYIRRILRIFPVFYTFLLAVAILQCFTPWSQNWVEWIGCLTFTQNFINSPDPTGHLWSLSVEEQFYLLWPLTLVYLIKHGATGRRILNFLAISIVVAPICRALGYHPATQRFFPFLENRSFFNYFDLLAVGCACAIYLVEARKTGFLSDVFHMRRRTVLLAGTVLVLVPYGLAVIQRSNYILRVFSVTVGRDFEAFGFALLILQSVFMPDWGIYRVLNWRWVSQIGILSYSIYIWQQMFCTAPQKYGLGQVWWMSFPCWLATAFIVACISYYGLERPILKLRARFGSRANKMAG